MNKFEQWLKKTYKPEPKPWKRKILFRLSSFVVCAVLIGAYSQYAFSYAGNEIWWLLGIFSVLGIGGLYTSVFGSEFWVAMFLGGL